jgi:hypothetical protein
VDLLHLRGTTDEDIAAVDTLDPVYDRLTDWITARELEPEETGSLEARTRRLAILGRLVDSDDAFADELAARRLDRRTRALRTLLGRARAEPQTSPLRKTVLSSLARACDALARDESSEVADVIVAVALHVTDPDDVATVAETCDVSELSNSLHAYAAMTRTTGKAYTEALLAQTRELPAGSSPRIEALRLALQRFARALDEVVHARSLSDVYGEESTLGALQDAVQLLAQIVAGAKRRLGARLPTLFPESGAAIHRLDVAIDRGELAAIGTALQTATSVLEQELPAPFAAAAIAALERVTELPQRPSQAAPSSKMPARPPPLPHWIPLRRTLGGFYVLRPIGIGGAGSVFIVRRLEERFDETAERFALKVPAYSGAVSRLLSEEQFLQLFREEAGALLALPHHPNLCRFVTFDAGVLPKPILVMELVEGPTLEHALERGRFTVPQAIAYLRGIGQALSAMHEVGVGHLDLKPANVILRKGSGDPVLVDFGLAGRHIRPGCATASYGAPEIWGIVPDEHAPQPMPADVYAFGALAFELLTGRALFEASTETAAVVAHLTHDGDPQPVKGLNGTVGSWLKSALRRDPRERASIDTLLSGLPTLEAALEGASWPLRV